MPLAAVPTVSDLTLRVESAAGLWQPWFPSADLVAAAAALVPAVRELTGLAVEQAEGPRWEFVISPGALQVRTKDWSKQSRTQERESPRRALDADALAGWIKDRGGLAEVERLLAEEASLPDDADKPITRVMCGRASTREITEWSRKSRNNMLRTFCQLDYTPLFADPTKLPAMITLTYPGAWLAVAPNGKAAKAQFRAWRERYKRAWGATWVGIWKLEFQDRGAPHFHLHMVPPHGLSTGNLSGLKWREWLSQSWAEVVNHPDPEEYRKHLAAGTRIDYAEGLKASDPKRLAVYFLKRHSQGSSKEYQHTVPPEWQGPGDGPGRFWGHCGLDTARIGVVVSPQDGVKVGRILRRWAHAQRTTRQATIRRVKGGAVTSAYSEVIGLAGAAAITSRKVRYRRSRVRVHRLPANRGWVSVNDGAAFASQITRWLAQ